MPSHKSAIKANRQEKKRQERNHAIKSRVKTAIKSTLKTIAEKDAEQAQATLKSTIRIVDKACSKGVLHKNNAARKKSALMRKANSL